MNALKLPETVTKVIHKFNAAGFEIYAVGGSVRDLLLGLETTAWDFTTSAKPAEIQKLFPESFYDNNFGTVGIATKYLGLPGTAVFEITTYRHEGDYRDYRHPEKISWGKTLEEDLKRRDFTINAIAFDGKTMVDPFQGQKDLQAKLIRAVGNPDVRFQEDALRLLRAVRIATKLNFKIEAATAVSIKKNAGLLSKISRERIKNELFAILGSPFPAEGVILLRDLGLLKEILPEVEVAFETQQKSPKRHHIYDVGKHLIESLRHCPSQDTVVRFACLLHDIGKPAVYQKGEDGVVTFYNHEIIGTKMVKKIAERLRLSRQEAGRLITLVRWHQFTTDEHQSDKAIRRFIRRVGKENLDDMIALRVADRLGGGATASSWRLELFKKRLLDVQKQPFSIADLKINGYEVMKTLNLKPGPKVGEVLKKLFEEVVEKKVPNQKDQLLKRLLSMTKTGAATKGEE